MNEKFLRISANVLAIFTMLKFRNIVFATDNYTNLNWSDFIILMGCFLSESSLAFFLSEDYPHFKISAYAFNVSILLNAIGLLCLRINLFILSKICFLITILLLLYSFLAFFIAVIKTTLEIVKKLLFNSNHM